MPSEMRSAAPPVDASAPPETIAGLLRWGAAMWPERTFASFADGETWTRRQTLDEALRTAAKLQAAGIEAGDRVFVMLPNSADWLRCWWGLAILNAIIVPVNQAFRGGILDGIFERLDPKMLIVEAGTKDRLSAEQQQRALIVGELMARSVPDTVEDVWTEPEPTDVHAIIMTSGTTGVSKGSMMAHRQLCRQAAWLIDGAGMSESDVFWADMPLFHLSGTSPITLMMRIGGSFHLQERPTLSNYWAKAKELGVTYSHLVGTMVGFLMSKPESPDETDHNLRVVLASPTPPDIEGFKRRFGLSGIVFAYGSSEASIMIVQPTNIPAKAGSCGKLRAGYEARIVDAEGLDVPDGEVGEIWIRNPTPGTMSLGYFASEEATKDAWEGGWFHSGDLMRRDADGYYYWLDRTKDSLRRRGENISSFEVEREVASHPAVSETACVAVKSELGGDDEVKVFIVPKAGATIDWYEMLEYLCRRMPYFMVPRFFELIADLPKTPTNRVQKYELRLQGNSEHTWDREAHGLTVDRSGRIRTLEKSK